MPVQRTQTNKPLKQGKYVESVSAAMPSKFFKPAESTQDDSVENVGQDAQENTKIQSCTPERTETIVYPKTSLERTSFKTQAGKKLTAHQWAVYDFALTIPQGKVTTYKDVSLAVGGSPRSVGNALRNNPFAPYVPCHRVIASNLFIGGFIGEWGKDHKTGTRCDQKLDILSKEGVNFDNKGNLVNASNALWKPE